MSEMPFSDPRATLRHVSDRLKIFGWILTAAGAIVILQAMLGSDGTFWRVLRGFCGFIGWVVPGLLYLLMAYALPKRKRWAIGGADIVTYLQLFFAGVMIIVSLLHIRGLWPMMILCIGWAAALLTIPKLTAQCPEAMDLLATQVTLGLDDSPRRESRRAK
jgi:hypothetical protein